MKIRCKHNNGKILPDEITCQAQGWDRKTKFPITLGKVYVVYAMEVLFGWVWYYIQDDEYDGVTINYPIHYPAFLFEVVDGSLSKYWNFNFRVSDQAIQNTCQLISYNEWLVEASYYDLLTDGNPREVQIYKKYEKLINEESM